MRARIMRAAARPTNKAAAANFTGLVLHEEVFAPEAPSRLRASRVSFTPGGRTNWHTHAVGQVLYVLTGVGRYHPGYLVESIMNPNAKIVDGPGYTDDRGLSTMPDYREHLTVSELIDLVAYLKSLGGGPEPAR